MKVKASKGFLTTDILVSFNLLQNSLGKEQQ